LTGEWIFPAAQPPEAAPATGAPRLPHRSGYFQPSLHGAAPARVLTGLSHEAIPVIKKSSFGHILVILLN
jgi:hypothetical protein